MQRDHALFAHAENGKGDGMSLAQRLAPQLLPEVLIVAVRASELQQAYFVEVKLLAFRKHYLGRSACIGGRG